MFNGIKNILLTSILCISFVNFAQATNHDDYDENYYEDEGRLLFKVRVHGVKVSATQKNLPAPTSTTPATPGRLIANGIGAETSTAIFFNDHIASELSLGFSRFRVKRTPLVAVANNYNGNLPGKRKNVYAIPLTLTGQYHIAPFGAVRPYIGAGYHGAYMLSKAKEFKISHGNGAVLQVGVDFVAKDDTLINFDIKQYVLSTKVTYKSVIVGANNVRPKLKLNPLVIAVGVGFMF